MIYFIEAVGAGLVKIGFTDRNIADRLKELQTASPHKLRLLLGVPGSLKDESDLHKRFADLRSQGEWFRADTQLAEYIRQVGFMAPLLERLHDVEVAIMEVNDKVHHRLLRLEKVVFGRGAAWSLGVSERVERLEDLLKGFAAEIGTIDEAAEIDAAQRSMEGR